MGHGLGLQRQVYAFGSRQFGNDVNMFSEDGCPDRMAEAMPADKYAWRPAPGVRSVSEVLIHLAQTNYYLLSVTGSKMPHDLERTDAEQAIVAKPEVVAYLRRSLDAVRTARTQLKPGDLQRKVKIEGKTVSVDGMYLRIICHDNECSFSHSLGSGTHLVMELSAGTNASEAQVTLR